ncbi:arylsulfatase [Maribacter algicola]|uniref:Arylsulfatase n=1 Tax=Meishania litoralis TaxID=3434685 RepID=A0ACC7LL23_9FLAO
MRPGLTILSLFVGLFFACKEHTQKPIPAQVKPNIVLIMADDQGWGDLGVNGNTNLSTPNIDALAKNGATFENFYVQPVCSPTRAELLTGRYARRLGVYRTSVGGERMNLNETTIAELLKQAGYETAAYGKWHNGMQPPYHPNSRGFDDYYGFASGHWGNYFSPMLEHNGRIVKGKGFLVDDLTDHGIDFMEKNRDNPFFLYLPLNTPHSPMQVPDAYWENFRDKNLAMKYLGDEEENENFTRAALAMVENIDHNVGRIMNKLRQLQLEESTIIIYLSDNGPNGWRWNGGMRGRKGSTDEGGVRTPFFIQWKDSIPAGKKIKQIGSALDLLPTLSNLVGIVPKTQKPLDGRNLAPLIFDENPEWTDRILFNHWNGKTSLRTQQYRLDAEDRLYDMVDDHGQAKDVAQEFPQLTDSLKKVKEHWLAEIIAFTRETDDRPITLGHPDFVYTQIPARDGIPHGNIERSSIHPNNTFFTNWKSVNDSITWDVEVLADGKFEVELHYTLKSKDAGVTLQLSHGERTLISVVTEAHDPPLTGMENDRDPRIESYVKAFKPHILGKIELRKGRNQLTLETLKMDGDEGIDMRLLMFKRIE